MFKHLNVQFPPLGRTKRGVSPTQLIDIRQKCLSLGCLKASEFYGQNAFFGYDESRIYLVMLINYCELRTDKKYTFRV